MGVGYVACAQPVSLAERLSTVRCPFSHDDFGNKPHQKHFLARAFSSVPSENIIPYNTCSQIHRHGSIGSQIRCPVCTLSYQAKRAWGELWVTGNPEMLQPSLGN